LKINQILESKEGTEKSRLTTTIFIDRRSRAFIRSILQMGSKKCKSITYRARYSHLGLRPAIKIKRFGYRISAIEETH
jgi:hypothetical protein